MVDHIEQTLRKHLRYGQLVLLQPPEVLAQSTLCLRVFAAAVLVPLLAPHRGPDCRRSYKLCMILISMTARCSVRGDVPGFEYTVAPLKAPSNIRMGVRTKRGPISVRDIWGGPLGCRVSFSTIFESIDGKTSVTASAYAHLTGGNAPGSYGTKSYCRGWRR